MPKIFKIQLVYLCLCSFAFCFAQKDKTNTSYIDVNYFKGKIALHNPDILHLIQGRPEGIIVGWNKKTFGAKAWEQRYNYPDYGVSFSYQDLKSEALGDNYSLYAHYNFYFLKRHLMVRIGQGLAYATNPFDKEDNFRNIAFGSRLLSSTYLMLNYKKERVFDRFGIQAGFALLHYSNGSTKAPNTSTNSITLNVGLTYNLAETDPEYQHTLAANDGKFTQPIKYNLAFRGGVNEADVVGSGQLPFYIISAYADKRITRKSALQLGAEAFYSRFLKEFIAFRTASFPEDNLTGDEDYKRVGVFVGHELFINKLSVISQFGYYVYYPFDFEGRTYIRIGLKRYFGKKWFAAVTLKSHAAKAEAVEYGVGIRL
jgi:hypothetical protein